MKALHILVYCTILHVTTICLSVQAQQFAETYEVENVLSGQKITESWDISKNNQWKIRTTRSIQTTKLKTAEEDNSLESYGWSQTTTPEDQNLYYYEFLVDAPYNLSPGESTFGYIYVKEKGTNVVKESWPVFFTVEPFKDRLWKAISTIYLPGNKIKIQVRVYYPTMYHVPILQQIATYKPGVDPWSTPTSAKNIATVLEEFFVFIKR